mgnify:CR=1 FL=1
MDQRRETDEQVSLHTILFDLRSDLDDVRDGMQVPVTVSADSSSAIDFT